MEIGNTTDDKLKLLIGSMLHDIGKVIYRTNDIRKHSLLGLEFIEKECNIKDKQILNCIRFHHGDDFKGKKLEKNDLAYITYIADNMAAAADRRDIEKGYGFDKELALTSIFNILNGNNKQGKYKAQYLNHDNGINFPEEKEVGYDSSYYKDIKSNLIDKLKQFELSEEYVESLQEILEGYLTYVPSSTSVYQIGDISLFDHLKLTAAFASCIYDYLKDKKIDDFTILKSDSKKYYEEKMFYMCSFDLSGIQNFIYTVNSKNALKGLRTRSFYLEILLEDVIDTLLKKLSLSRANLLYSGGGHCYLLLPNTEKVKQTVEETIKEVNDWIIDKFKTELFLAYGGTDCSSSAFNAENTESYTEIFRNISQKLSNSKLHRYNGEQLKKLNFIDEAGNQRECKICQCTDNLIESDDGDMICTNCDNINKFSNKIMEAEFFCVEDAEKSTEVDYLNLPFNHILTATNQKRLQQKLISNSGLIRAYSKNDSFSGKKMSTKLWVGDYLYNKELNILSKDNEGINRLAVIRADVDNLGQAFVKGFESKYASLTRSATFSRNMSLFFKYHINYILENPIFSIRNKKPENRKAMIIYSGGDDIFIVGAWKDILEFSIDIKNSLKKFTMDSLTMSAGIGIYPEKYPIKTMSLKTGDLEENAKNNVYYVDGIEKTKNSVSLFESGLTFSWEEFEEKVLGEKFKLIDGYLRLVEERGKAFIYKIVQLLRGDLEKEKLDLARLAYILGRLEPSNKENSLLYREFSQKIYSYSKNKKDRKELIAAIYVYIYLERDVRNDK